MKFIITLCSPKSVFLPFRSKYTTQHSFLKKLNHAYYPFLNPYGGTIYTPLFSLYFLAVTVR